LHLFESFFGVDIAVEFRYDAGMENKVCALCKETHPIESFQLNSKTGKRSSYCPICHKQKKRESYERNRESTIAKSRAYALENLEKTQEYQAQYRDEHREERNENERIRRIEKHDEIREQANYRYANDPEYRQKRKAQHDKWRIEFNQRLDADPDLRDQYRLKWAAARDRWNAANPEKAVEIARASSALRRARVKTGNHYELITSEYIDLLKIQQNSLCMYCEGFFDKLDIDHIIPLSRGGHHDPENVCLACKTCNRSKSNKFLHSEWVPPKDRT